MRNITKLAILTAKSIRCSLIHPTHDEFVAENVYGGNSVFEHTITHLRRHTICEKCGDLDAVAIEVNLLEIVVGMALCFGFPAYLILTAIHHFFNITF